MDFVTLSAVCPPLMDSNCLLIVFWFSQCPPGKGAVLKARKGTLNILCQSFIKWFSGGRDVSSFSIMLPYQTILIFFWGLQLLCAMSLECWFWAWWWLQAILFAVWILFCLKVIVFLCYLCVLPPPRYGLHVRLFWSCPMCPMCNLLFLDFDKEIDCAVILTS